jgi:ATP-dependent Clp protease protease subunit
MHQVLGGVSGQASDIEIAAREAIRHNNIIRGILAERTGQPMEKIIHDTDRDFYLDAQGALDYGLVDEILARPQDAAAASVAAA